MVAGGNSYLRAILNILSDTSMVVLTRDERQRRVIELHNQGKGTREIAEILQMSFRDIGLILREADKEKETEQQRTRQEFLSSRAYKKFSERKSPAEVAIELNIRAQEAIVFQREYWQLEGLHQMNQIYEQIKDDTWHLINLWRLVRVSGMNLTHVITLLKVANNDLATLEYRYETLQKEIKSLQEQKIDLYNQVTEEGSNVEYYRVQSQLEIDRLKGLQERRKKAESLVTQFENNDVEYIKIRKTVEEKVRATLSNAKTCIYLALYCLIESIKENPYRYSPLISENKPPSESYFTDGYPPYSYSYDRPTYFDVKAMLAEEAAKMYEVLSRDLVDQALRDYPTSQSPQLPLRSFHPNTEQNGTA